MMSWVASRSRHRVRAPYRHARGMLRHLCGWPQSFLIALLLASAGSLDGSYAGQLRGALKRRCGDGPVTYRGPRLALTCQTLVLSQCVTSASLHPHFLACPPHATRCFLQQQRPPPVPARRWHGGSCRERSRAQLQPDQLQVPGLLAASGTAAACRLLPQSALQPPPAQLSRLPRPQAQLLLPQRRARAGAACWLLPPSPQQQQPQPQPPVPCQQQQRQPSQLASSPRRTVACSSVM